VTPPAAAVRTPAKVNLSLRVLGRRADGFHELDTVFQAIDLWDRLEMTAGDELKLTCDLPELSCDRDNLVLRAAELLLTRHGEGSRGGTIHLSKAIPVSGGLGGGSSDAAAALVLCSRFWGLHLERPELVELAAELGADVPFFLHGGTARGLGRGDLIEPLEFAGPTPLLLGVPPYGISTAEVFSRLSSRLTHPSNGVNLPALSAHKLRLEKDFWLPTNDLEGVVFEGWPALREFRDALLAVGADRALLSGSGSTVYGAFDDDAGLRVAMTRLRKEFEEWKLIPTRAVARAVETVPWKK
jgi:4-diphosphocytidyl-2-C-methyl-D-erythritol kinase